MKTFSGAVLIAFLLAAPVIADAATAENAASATQSGASASSVYAANASHPYAVLDDQDDAHLMPTSPVSRSNVRPLDGTLRLLNRTGSGR
jgi:hypothetical protein